MNTTSTNSTLSPAALQILAERRERYIERRERRIDNAQSRMLENNKLSLAHYRQSQRMGQCIPMGQPIHIGHHSEGRDRRFRKRMWDTMGKSVEANAKASYYEGKLTAIESNTAIYSTDPDAIAKLRAKIIEAGQNQSHWKAGNKIVKSKKLSPEQKAEQLTAAGHSPDILKPDFAGRIGYPAFELSNNNANIRRMETRLQELEQSLNEAVELGDTENTYPDLNLTIKQARSIDRLQLVFNGKPNAEIRTLLKCLGYRWAPSEAAWQRKLVPSNFTEIDIVKRIRSLAN